MSDYVSDCGGTDAVKAAAYEDALEVIDSVLGYPWAVGSETSG